jgi:hypothetical protein
VKDSITDCHKGLVAEGKAIGLPDSLAKLYADRQVETLTNAINAKYSNPNIGGPQSPVLGRGKLQEGDIQQTKSQATREQAAVYRKLGVAPKEAQERAERDVSLVEDTARYGGSINYAAPVGQIHEQAEQLEKSVQSARQQVLMGFPEGGRGGRPLNDQVRKQVLTHDDIIQRASDRYGVDANLIRGVIAQESEGKPGAVNPHSGATGLMQLMKDTAGPRVNREDPEQNIMAGTAHLRAMLDKYHGNKEQALAAYNAGEGNVHRWEQIKETRKYVPQVLSYEKQFAAMDTGTLAQETAGLDDRKGKVDFAELQKRVGVKGND